MTFWVKWVFGIILWSKISALYNCDAIKQNESEVKKIWFFFLFFCFVLFFLQLLLGYNCLGFNLVKTPQRLGNWFQRYKQLKDWTNNKKQKKLSALFGCMLKTVFASSNLIPKSSSCSYCLRYDHLCIRPQVASLEVWFWEMRLRSFLFL